MSGLAWTIPPWADPPWTTPPASLAAIRLYAGDGPDELSLAAVAPAGAESLAVPQSPGQRRYYRLRRTSAQGVEEHSTHVSAVAAIDADGQLEPAPLPRPFDVAVARDPYGRLVVGFCWRCRPYDAMPDGFDVVAGASPDALDLDAPLVRVATADATGERVVPLPSGVEPACLAVRAVRDGLPGPISPVITRRVALPPAPPALL